MRTSLRCQQCLSRIRQHAVSSQRSRDVRLHTAAARHIADPIATPASVAESAIVQRTGAGDTRRAGSRWSTTGPARRRTGDAIKKSSAHDDPPLPQPDLVVRERFNANRKNHAREPEVLPVSSVPPHRRHGSSRGLQLRDGRDARGSASPKVVRHRPYARIHVPRDSDLQRRLQESLRDIPGDFKQQRVVARDYVRQLKQLYRESNELTRPQLVEEFFRWKSKFGRILAPVPETLNSEEELQGQSDDIFLESIQHAWLQQADHTRDGWARVLLSTLQSTPAMLPRLMMATYDPSWSPAFIVEDMVRLLLLRLEADQTSSDVISNDLVDLVAFIYQSRPSHDLLQQDILAKILARTPPARVRELYELFRENGLLKTDLLKLNFVRRFAQDHDHQALAIDTMCSLSTEGLQSPAGIRVATTLFNMKSTTASPTQTSPTMVLQRLVDKGYHPNLINLTPFMRRLCQQGRLDKAWNVFDLLPQYGVEPDTQVYSLLLKSSKDQLDVNSAWRVLSVVHSRKAWHVDILNEFLDFLYRSNEARRENHRFRRQRKADNAYRPMLAVYAKFFLLEPLQTLVPSPVEDLLGWQGLAARRRYATEDTELAVSVLALPDREFLEPNTLTLMIMLAAYVRRLSDPELVLSTYHHLNNLFVAGDQSVCGLVKEHGSWLFDVLLRSMLQFKKTLDPALGLFKNMVQKEASGQGPAYPVPSKYTWAIMTTGVANHSQPQLAKHMFDMMREAGNVVTSIHHWNTLLGAYVKVEDIRSAVRAMQAMEESGLKADERTIQIFSRLPADGRQQAVELMETYERSREGSRQRGEMQAQTSS